MDLAVSAVAPRESAVVVPDGEMLACLRRGDATAFAVVMRRNNRRLFRLARSIVHDNAEAEDVLQESYLRAFSHLDRFNGEASLATWLARIVINEALGRLRRRRTTVELDEIEKGCADTGKPDDADPERAAARREIGRILEHAIDRLPANFRTVFILRMIEQLSIAETAAILGIAPETVKTRQHRASRLLQEALHGEFAAILDDAFPFAGSRCERMTARVIAQLAQSGITTRMPMSVCL